MKKIILLSAILFFSATQIWAQEKMYSNYPMLGDDAPAFTAESTKGTVNFPADYNTQWKVLFSHPADFTPVCTSEILELAAAQKDFDDLGVKIVVMSVDNLQSHNEWIKSMETINYKDRETFKINFPLVSDVSLQVSRAYGMIQPNGKVQANTHSTKDVRGVFIIDPKNKIQAIFFYPMNIGRNLAEIKRTIVALQTAEMEQVLIPANWNKGEDVLIPYIKYTSEEDKLTDNTNPDYYQYSWYMRFKKGSNQQ
ncbi:MAG: peroxiredoxin [Bacteroidales bacterium]|nr:peroxiredoxin [Bacteroidales bacterium]